MPAVTLKISREVAESLHRAAAAAGRSLSAQVEHWARIAMMVEDRATVTEVNAIKQMRGDVANIGDPKMRERVRAVLDEVRREWGASPIRDVRP